MTVSVAGLSLFLWAVLPYVREIVLSQNFRHSKPKFRGSWTQGKTEQRNLKGGNGGSPQTRFFSYPCSPLWGFWTIRHQNSVFLGGVEQLYQWWVHAHCCHCCTVMLVGNLCQLSKGQWIQLVLWVCSPWIQFTVTPFGILFLKKEEIPIVFYYTFCSAQDWDGNVKQCGRGRREWREKFPRGCCSSHSLSPWIVFFGSGDPTQTLIGSCHFLPGGISASQQKCTSFTWEMGRFHPCPQTRKAYCGKGRGGGGEGAT